MSFLDVINYTCTIISVIGAYNSIAYYKKSKQLTIYANTNIAYIESKKIIATLTEILKLANNTRRRGIYQAKEVAKHGESVKTSLNKIRESLTVEDYNEIKKLLNSKELQVEAYIDSFITGDILVNEKLVIDKKFSTCQSILGEVQLVLKKKLENLSDKAK